MPEFSTIWLNNMAQIIGGRGISTVKAPRDPGLNVPEGVFTGGGASQLGKGLSAVDESIAQFSDKQNAAEDRIKTRQEALDRMKARTEFREHLRDTLQASSSTEDLSDSGVLTAYGEQGRAKFDEILGVHNGRAESRSKLEISMEGDFEEFRDKASGLGVKAGDARTQAQAGEVINGLEARAFLGEDTDALIDEGMDQIRPGSDLADAMRPGDEINYARSLKQRIVTAKMERLFEAQDTDGIQDAVEDPAVQRALGEKEQRSAFRRREAIRRDRAKRSTVVLSEGDVLVDEATGEEIASAPAEEKPEKLVTIFFDDPDAPEGTPKTKLVRESDAEGQPGPARGPLVSIIEQGKNRMVEKLGELDAERIIQLEDDAQTAFRVKAEVTRMRAAVESGRFTTGVFSDFRVFLARFADFVGASEKTKELLGDAATSDTLDAATNRLGVEAASKLGRITNMSLQFVKDSLPSLARTPEGNLILMEVMDRTADREIALASLANEFLQRHGTLRPEEGRSYFQAVRDLETEDPVITEELRQRIIDGSTQETQTFAERFGITSDVPTISTQEEVDALEPGTKFIWGPTGESGTKDQ